MWDTYSKCGGVGKPHRESCGRAEGASPLVEKNCKLKYGDTVNYRMHPIDLSKHRRPRANCHWATAVEPWIRIGWMEAREEGANPPGEK